MIKNRKLTSMMRMMMILKMKKIEQA